MIIISTFKNNPTAHNTVTSENNYLPFFSEFMTLLLFQYSELTILLSQNYEKKFPEKKAFFFNSSELLSE